MPNYDFRGRNTRGELVSGVMNSPSPEGVATRLISAGLQPVSIEEKGQRSTDPAWFRNLTGADVLKPAELLLLTRQMGAMVKAGVPIMRVLSSIQGSQTKPHIIEIIQAIRDDLDRGLDLSSALGRHPKSFSEFYVSMVRVGEGSGQLDTILARIHQQLEFDSEIKNKIKAALRYPSFVIVGVFIAMVVLSLYVIPVFSGMFRSMKLELPLVTRILIETSDFTVAYWWAVFAGVIGAVILFRKFTAQKNGRYWWDKTKLKLPIMGSIIYKASMARFAYTFALAERSGVPLIQTFSLISRVLENAYYEEKILQMRDGVQNGESLAEVTRTAGIFSPLEIQMITVGEEAGEVEQMLQHVAEMHQSEVNQQVGKLSQSLEPLILLSLAVVVTVLMLGIFLPLWDISSSGGG